MKKKGKKKTKSAKKTSRPGRSKASKRARVRKAPKRPTKKAPKRARLPAPSAPAASTVPHPRPKVIAPANSVLLGYVEDYYAHVSVIAFTLQSPVSLGRRIQVLGYTTHFEQTIDSMQMDHQPVTQANPGDGVGVKVIARARAGDHVYLLL